MNTWNKLLCYVARHLFNREDTVCLHVRSRRELTFIYSLPIINQWQPRKKKKRNFAIIQPELISISAPLSWETEVSNEDCEVHVFP